MPHGQPKLIITVTPNASWIYPGVQNWPETPEEIADCVHRCYKAGASIAHIHAANQQEETTRRIREKCDIIVQFGLSADPLKERRHLFKAKPDMMSIMTTHHDEQFTGASFNILHEKSELEEYCRLCLRNGVKPEFEIWHFGGIWNLRYLEEAKLIKKPYFLSTFFGWPGGSWSPPTVDEFMHRTKYFPKGSLITTSIMDPTQMEITIAAIAGGSHVRVGTEDNPFVRSKVPAKDNSDLVANVAEISRRAGREVATAAEAREMIGLNPA